MTRALVRLLLRLDRTLDRFRPVDVATGLVLAGLVLVVVSQLFAWSPVAGIPVGTVEP